MKGKIMENKIYRVYCKVCGLDNHNTLIGGRILDTTYSMEMEAISDMKYLQDRPLSNYGCSNHYKQDLGIVEGTTIWKVVK